MIQSMPTIQQVKNTFIIIAFHIYKTDADNVIGD